MDKRLTIKFWQVLVWVFFQKVKNNMKGYIPVFSDVIRMKTLQKKIKTFPLRGKGRTLLTFPGNFLATGMMDPNRGTQTNL